MKSWLNHILRAFSTVLYIFVYWIVIYIGIDKLNFELSTHNIHFASAKVVYDLFLINIVASLLLAQLIAVINLILSFKSNKKYKYFNLIHVPLLIIYIYIIFKSETVIPFIKNWHVALFGTNYYVGGS
jgi:hypothetical protein